MVEERVPTGFVGKIIGRNFYNRESLVKNPRERRTLGSEEDLSLASSFFVVVLGARGSLLVGVNQNKDTSRATRTAVYTGGVFYLLSTVQRARFLWSSS